MESRMSPEFIQFGSHSESPLAGAGLEQLYRWAQEPDSSRRRSPRRLASSPPLADPRRPAFNPEDPVDPDLARVVDERFTQSLDPITQQLDLLLQG